MNSSMEKKRVKKAKGIIIFGLTRSENHPTSGMPITPKITDMIMTYAQICDACYSSLTLVPMKLVMKRSQQVLKSVKYMLLIIEAPNSK